MDYKDLQRKTRHFLVETPQLFVYSFIFFGHITLYNFLLSVLGLGAE